MLEKPELDYVAAVLQRELAGVGIRAVQVRRAIVLRQFVEGTPDQVVGKHSFGAVRRHGRFLLFELLGPHDIEMVALPMHYGRFALGQAGGQPSRDLSLSFRLTDGRELRYRDEVQRGKIYFIKRGSWKQVPGLEAVGVDVLDQRIFTPSVLRVLLRDRREQSKPFLMDQSVLDGLGEAYSDEVLWEAQVHPKTKVSSLSVDEAERMYEAIVRVLGRARDALAAKQPPIDELPSDWLQVRGRAGSPCPRCGGKLTTTRVFTDDAVLCAACQPERRLGTRIEWRQISGAE